jgi:hypothetical protein
MFSCASVRVTKYAGNFSLKGKNIRVRFVVFTAVTMKNAVFWDVAPCRSRVNRRFGGTYRLHLQGIRNPRAMNQVEQVLVDSWISYTLKMEAIHSSETSVNKISTRRHIPEDGILQVMG